MTILKFNFRWQKHSPNKLQLMSLANQLNCTKAAADAYRSLSILQTAIAVVSIVCISVVCDANLKLTFYFDSLIDLRCAIVLNCSMLMQIIR